jgi:hypothetical protein
MKLDRCGVALAALVTLSLMGCGTRVSTKTVACPPSPTVSTTRLMAAELRDADDRPKVSKSQHSSATVAEESSVEKDDAHRRGDRRPGGGFSGYK